MNLYIEHTLSSEQRSSLFRRSIRTDRGTGQIVQNLCQEIKQHGDGAVRKYTAAFDGIDLQALRVPSGEIRAAIQTLSSDVVNALTLAMKNIRMFHESQRPTLQRISTMEGVVCWRETRPIERVGLYVPAGSASLPSTLLMLGVPAIAAGCSRIVVCSPPKAHGSVDPYVLAVASMLGIEEIYNVGGAQAIAAMAYGTETIQKVDKIFGPGNRYVTAAKQFVSVDPDGAAIDLLAGPSEVLIIADDSASPDNVAYDLISQAEHDPDARSILITTSTPLAQEVMRILPEYASECARNTMIQASLAGSYILVVDSLSSAIKFSNEYAPEHLMLNIDNSESVLSSIRNAGSVFVGPYAPVTAGDYASGTNHTLPTNGAAKWASGASLDSFQKYVSFQSISKSGLEGLAPTLTTLAGIEGLQAHALAVNSRFLPDRATK
jgi:histidinol dehydrogenase